MNKSGLADSPFFLQPIGRTQKISDSLISKRLDNRNSIIFNVCNSIQTIGKKASTYRLTKEEKRLLAKIIFKFRTKEVCLTENIIIRLSVNYIIQDFLQNNKTSILSRVIKKMNF